MMGTYKVLTVYQKAFDLDMRISEVTKRFQMKGDIPEALVNYSLTLASFQLPTDKL